MSGEPYEVRPKKRRKRRRSEGEDIFHALTKDRATLDLGKDKGLRCRSCGKWRPWRDLGTKYEMRGSDLIRMWLCDQCADVLLEQNVTDQAIQLRVDEEHLS